MSDPAPQYDERASMRQYDRCSCGRVKGRAARQCKRCWDLERRVRDRKRQWARGKDSEGGQVVQSKSEGSI